MFFVVWFDSSTLEISRLQIRSIDTGPISIPDSPGAIFDVFVVDDVSIFVGLPRSGQGRTRSCSTDGSSVVEVLATFGAVVFDGLKWSS